jgi:hypothetical protein
MALRSTIGGIAGFGIDCPGEVQAPVGMRVR